MKKYLINLLGYIGVGFVSGAVSHGFFSGTRSLIMAGLGVFLFLIAQYLQEDGNSNYFHIFVFGLLYSLCIGMISGGLQHFLDSPERSLWIIPVGFVLGYAIYTYQYDRESMNIYSTSGAIFGGLVLAVLGYTAYIYLPASVYTMGDHHDIQTSNTQVASGTQIADWMQNLSTEQIKQHCESMPNMQGCDAYISSSGDDQNNHTNHQNHGDMINSEFEYIYLMIPHHQEAVDTSKTLLTYISGDSELSKLARDIISGQEAEIAMMRGWLSQRYSGAVYSGMGYMPMMDRYLSAITQSATMKFATPQDRSDYISKARLADMIIHHQGAIDMSNKVLTLNANHLAVSELAQNIISLQNNEIKLMQGILEEINTQIQTDYHSQFHDEH